MITGGGVEAVLMGVEWPIRVHAGGGAVFICSAALQRGLGQFMVQDGMAASSLSYSCFSAISIARSSPRALFIVSSYSLAGTLSATMPAPT